MIKSYRRVGQSSHRIEDQSKRLYANRDGARGSTAERRIRRQSREKADEIHQNIVDIVTGRVRQQDKSIEHNGQIGKLELQYNVEQ